MKNTDDELYVSMYCYPWDIVDEGISAFAHLVEGAGLGNITLAASYHAGKHLLPHNRSHRVYYVEDGAVYFRPNNKLFQKTTIKPVASTLVKDADEWRRIVNACQRRNIGLTAWVVTFHNARLGSTYPHLTTQNVFGDRYPHALCPSQPAVMQYVLALARNLASYDIRAVEWESFKFIPFRHFSIFENEGIPVTPSAELLLSLCFCSACMAEAKRLDINGTTVAKAVRAWLARYFDGKNRNAGAVEPTIAAIGGLADYLQMRVGVVDRAVREVTDLLHALGRRVYMIGPDQQRTYTTARELTAVEHSTGFDMERLGARVDAINFLFYEQRPAEAPVVVRKIRQYTRGKTNIYFAVRPCYPDANSAGDVMQMTNAVIGAGARGISYYNFGLFEKFRLAWIAKALAASRALAKANRPAEAWALG